MVDVFISYSRSNEQVVARLAEAVEAAGYDVWWDVELPPHLSYGEVITEKIGAAKAAIVVWSRAAAASEWVRAEADVARNQKKLIQVSVDDAMPPLPFNQIQFASIGDWDGAADHPGWRKVKASLAVLCGPRGESAAPVPAPPSPRTVVPPAPPAPPPPPAAQAGRSQGLVIGLLALLVLVAGAAVYLLLLRAEGGGGGEKVAGQQPQPASAGPGEGASPRFTHAAVISDPDGYTNVRSAASTQSASLAQVRDGEVFTTFPQQGEWWQVRTADGTIGYMAASRIRLTQAARSGAASTAAAPARSSSAADPPLVLPDSSSRLLTEEDLAPLGLAQLRVARNEIFARNGRRFADPALRRHFERYSWYVPRTGEPRLNAVEAANVRLIEEAEQNVSR